jgi:hypothetical protein
MSAYAGGEGNQGEQGPPGLDQRPVTWTFDPLVDAATGDGQAFWFVPAHMNGWVLTAVEAGADTPGTASSTLIQIRNATQALDMLSTRIGIDANEAHSKDAGAPVIDASNDTVAYGDKIVVDIDQLATGTRGLQVHAIFSAP